MEGHIQSTGKKKEKLTMKTIVLPKSLFIFSEYSFLCQHIIQVTE